MKNIFVLFVTIGLLVFFVSGSVLAAQYDIKQMTPAIQSALESRRDRFETLEQFKDSGTIGENNSGYVEVLVADTEAATLAQKENQDRRVIYAAIAEQNGLMEAFATIETVFADVQRTKAKSGQFVELPDGTWIKI
jgi:uncharacterized protein